MIHSRLEAQMSTKSLNRCMCFNPALQSKICLSEQAEGSSLIIEKLYVSCGLTLLLIDCKVSGLGPIPARMNVNI